MPTISPSSPRRRAGALSPVLNPTGLGSAAAAVYAAVVMIWNATHHMGVIDPQVVIAALAAAAFLYTRFRVTPIADPRDGNGAPLKTANAHAADNLARVLSEPGSTSGNVTLNPPPEAHP